MASTGFHETEGSLRPETRDLHRAIVSLMEELEAIDWYQQRVDATADADLRAILAHNRDEEQEHAAMLLEWIRRRDPRFAERMREYLFTTSPITAHEAAVGATPDGAPIASPAPAAGARASVGSLRGRAA